MKELNLDDNTYIIYTSDNGSVPTIPARRYYKETINYPLSRGKWDAMEGGIRVPFIVSGPGIKKNSESKVPVVGYDLLPTIIDLAGSKIQDLDKIAEAANNTNYGLAASVWSKDISTAHKLAGKIRAGTVWINCHNIFDASLPFGGYKESGWGREMGHEVLHAYTELKAVTVNL